MLRMVCIGIAAVCGLATEVHADNPKEHIVKIVSDYENLRMYFKPKSIRIALGDKVTWVNVSAEEHNIISYPDGYPKNAQPLLSHYLKKKDEKWSHTFTVEGSYEYHCIPHLPLGMHGIVIVSRPSEEAEYHVPSAKEMKKYSEQLREFFDEEDFQYKPRNHRATATPDTKLSHAHKI